MSTGSIDIAELRQRLGGIPVGRIRLNPPPGSATEADALAVQDREGRTCELLDGVLVEKATGYYESHLASIIGAVLREYVRKTKAGIVLAPDGLLQVLPEKRRAADVAFLSWDHFPNRKLPREQVPSLAPDLAIEILSPGNTRFEMEQKRADFFAGGTQLIWIIDPDPQSARVFRRDGTSAEVARGGVLSGEELLPGFELSLQELFEEAGERE